MEDQTDLAISKEYALEQIREEITELEDILVGEEPSNEYQKGARDMAQHSLVAVKGVLED